MSLSRYLEEIAKHIDSSKVPKTYKMQLLAGLNYFKQQVLCDLDRRDSQVKLKQRWLEFQQLTVGTGLLDKFQRDRYRWNIIQKFFGIELASEPIPFRPAIKKSRLADKGTDLLLELLARESEEKKSLSEMELNVVKFGLYYLHLESRRGRGQRDKNRIKLVWKTIQPMLRKMGMLDEFDSDLEAKKKIKAFITDRFL